MGVGSGDDGGFGSVWRAALIHRELDFHRLSDILGTGVAATRRCVDVIKFGDLVVCEDKRGLPGNENLGVPGIYLGTTEPDMGHWGVTFYLHFLGPGGEVFCFDDKIKHVLIEE